MNPFHYFLNLFLCVQSSGSNNKERKKININMETLCYIHLIISIHTFNSRLNCKTNDYISVLHIYTVVNTRNFSMIFPSEYKILCASASSYEVVPTNILITKKCKAF